MTEIAGDDVSSIGDLYRSKAARLKKAGASISDHPQDDLPRRRVNFDIPRALLPIPTVARAVLLLLGARDGGRYEKTAFELSFDLDGTPCVFALRKFGLDLNAWLPEGESDEGKQAFFDSFIRRMQNWIRIAETDIFYPEIKREIARGELAVVNNAGSLWKQYLYFREGAEIGFDKRGRLQPAPPADDDNSAHAVARSIAFSFNSNEAATREGSFNASAMVNSYFSYLEHYLALALPFTDVDLDNFDLQKFLGDSWATKFKTVVDISRDPNTKALYDRLVHVAETYRNPLAHGGWDKRGATANVNVPGLGRVPLLLSGIEKTVGFKMHAFDPESFADLCTLLDQSEDLLRGPLLGNAPEWIGSGFDVFFDSEERSKYHADEAEFNAHMELRSALWEREVNMEW